ncbi:MAG TPA: flagellar hook-length control protein FliK [Rhodocyclaceae bacterium]|nr:flagellar hook-length control protein FliK [Rhodocyclaceae bacterium]
MAADRISAVAHTLPAQSRGSALRQRAPAAGETMRLTYADTVGDDLLVSAGDGRTLRLTGLANLGQELSEGDVLLVRVLSSMPNLELELFGSLTRQGRPTGQPMPAAEPASMRFDQAALRQVSWRAPDPAVLATSWRALVHGQLRGQLHGQFHAEGLQAGATGLVSGAYLSHASDPGREIVSGNFRAMERWAFPVYAWGGMPMMLRLVSADQEEEEQRAPRERPRSLALRLDLDLPGLGRVALQVQWITGGIQLSLAVADPAALEPLRDLLPEMTKALARAGLRLLRCRLSQGLPGFDAAPSALPQGAAAAVPPGLFRAAAEVVVALIGNPQSAINSTNIDQRTSAL